MRVLQVVGSLAIGGAERVALAIAVGLRARGDEASILVAGRASSVGAYEDSLVAEAERRGVAIDRVDFAGVRDRGSRTRLAAFLRQGRFDVVHAHNRPQDWQLVALCRVLGIPVVYTVHSSTLLTRRQRALYALVARAVPKVVCVSRSVARHVETHEHVPARRIQVIYNGIDPDRFRPSEPAARAQKRAELGWADADSVWICAARLVPVKGHRFMLEAMARPEVPPRSRLALAGDGPLAGELAAQAASLGLGGRVIFLGGRKDVPELLGAADGFLSASLSEGHPLSLLEAMAAELPVVAPRLPSVLEIATTGAPVLYGPDLEATVAGHDPAAIASALRAVGEEDARRAARASRAHVAKSFSIAAMMDAHQALYRALTAC